MFTLLQTITPNKFYDRLTPPPPTIDNKSMIHHYTPHKFHIEHNTHVPWPDLMGCNSVAWIYGQLPGGSVMV